MRHLLKAMGFWIWGLLIIGLAASIANLGYRWASHFQLPHFAESAPSSPEHAPSPSALSPHDSVQSLYSIDSAGAESFKWLKHPATRESPADINRQIEGGQELFYHHQASTGDLVQLVTRTALARGCGLGLLWANRAIEYNARAGRNPSPELLAAKFGCTKDKTEAITTATELVRLSDKPNWWRQWLRLHVEGQRDARLRLMYFRIGNLAGILEPQDAVNFASLLDYQGMYGEARRVATAAEKALLNSKDPSTQSSQRELESMGRFSFYRADPEARTLAKLINSLDHSPETLARIGALSYGQGNFATAVRALTTALPGLARQRTPEDSYVYLALSQLELKQKEDALATFSAMFDLPLNAEWRDAWQLYIDLKL